uniref:Transcriptional adapter n=1 Tax=Riptortus pedestris TaxID=329032 RepID=R4WDV5_RIPPE|nr:unkown protein [Riptortus pedestris]
MASDLFAKYSCTYCLDDIVGIRVKCVECKDFDLCLQCFSAGAEIGPHKNDHSYQFVDPGAVEIFRSKNKWTAREELQLLNGIEQYGFGNWEEISEHIKTRTAEEVKEEYMFRYVEGSIGRCTWLPAYERRAKLKDLGTDLPVEESSSWVPPLDVTPEQATQLGYMPQRGDFEREYQNEAESLVSRLNTSTADEDELDVALKLVHVDMYMDRLRERSRIKKVVRDYQLISKFFADRKDRHTRRRSSQEQEVEEKLKCFCTFHSVEHHESLVRSMQRQRELEQRLSELLRYRRAGLTRMEELAHYEQELARSRGSFLGTLSSDGTEKKKRRRRRGKHQLFHHKKLHAPHRQPFLIARARAAAAAAAHSDP